MRVVLMVLVLANLGFLAWQQWHTDTTPLPPGRTDASLGQGLTLVGEQQPAVAASEPAVEQTPSSQRVPPPDLPPAGEPEESVRIRCASLGPFDDSASAEVVSGRLAELGHAALVREAGGQIRSGFWVYLPPFGSRDAARQVESELRERGVRDLFIVTESEQRNAISLGLYSTPERADQRAAEIGRLGFTPRVAERFRDATVYWVDFRERADQPLEPESIGVMGAGDTLPEKREISCSEIAEARGEA